MTTPSGHTAVMAQKRPRLSDGKPWQDRELFPTPPWATRALIEEGIGYTPLSDGAALGKTLTCWEPCAGLGHMSDVLREYFAHVTASDVHIYDNAPGYVQRCDALDHEAVRDFAGRGFDWIITNPPFTSAQYLLPIFMRYARAGVAMLLRMQWLEGRSRYENVFNEIPPARVLVFTERVPMCEGGYDPKLSTATAYAWFVWDRSPLEKRWIAPPYWERDHLGRTWLSLRLFPATMKKTFVREGDLALAARHVPGFVPPSTLKKSGKAQQRLLP